MMIASALLFRSKHGTIAPSPSDSSCTGQKSMPSSSDSEPSLTADKEQRFPLKNNLEVPGDVMLLTTLGM